MDTWGLKVNCASESEDRGPGKGVGVYTTLLKFQVTERNVGMERVWVCILRCCRQIQYRHMVEEKEALDLWGVCLL